MPRHPRKPAHFSLRRQFLQTRSLVILELILLPGVGLLGRSDAAHGQSVVDKSVDLPALPELADTLAPQQVGDLTTCLLSRSAPAVPVSTAPSKPLPKENGFRVEESTDRLRISLSGQPVVDFVFRDDRILRPYFANARLADGRQITRNHPPVDGVDALDHDTNHPGIWLGFGDISGQDFWRNKAPIEHVRFIWPPAITDGRLQFATECRLKTNTGQPLCMLTNHFALTARPRGWLLVWSAAFHADQQDFTFGDQEEMGFGARVATPFIEKNGGFLRSSTGEKTAKATWGQPADWCDYSGTSGDRSGGIMLMASPDNFRRSWWHNRDYGVFVANPFGREAMKQGTRSTVTVARGETLRIVFGALVHDNRDMNPAAEFNVFEQTLPSLRKPPTP